MPSITAPTLGSGFYTPRSAGSYNYPSKKQQSVVADTNADSIKNFEEDTEIASSEIQQKAKELLSTLTADDIQQMSKNGLLNQLGNILGADTSSMTGVELSNLYTSKSKSASNILLSQVISEIEEIKEQNKKLQEQVANITKTLENENAYSSYSNTGSIVANNTASSSRHTQSSHLIKFSVNGYDVLRTCHTIYISDVQQDGTFLVTGDRKYQSDGKTRSETFHLLFKTAANSSSQTYSAAAAVTQDSFNQYSFLYQLSQRDDLQATRIGNLVSMKTVDPDWKLELLIDLGEEN